MILYKECTICKKLLPITNFVKRSTNYYPYCNKCHYERYKKINKEKRTLLTAANKRYIKEYLQRHGCKYCGEKDPTVLQFNHKLPKNKKDKISHLVNQGYSLKTIQKEINKCEVVCVNCHKKITASQQGWYLVRWYKYYLQNKQVPLNEQR